MTVTHGELAGSLQMLATLSVRRRYLSERQLSVAEQVVHRAAVMYRSGDLDMADLLDLYGSVRDASSDLPGWFKTWKESGLPTAQAMKGYIFKAAKGAPTEPDGSWVGENPDPPSGQSEPVRGISVVYLLFGSEGDPIYLGSTGNLKARMRAHRRDGKEFAFWQAWPCRDRQDAYEREDEMLRTVLPRLNRKAGR